LVQATRGTASTAVDRLIRNSLNPKETFDYIILVETLSTDKRYKLETNTRTELERKTAFESLKCLYNETDSFRTYLIQTEIFTI